MVPQLRSLMLVKAPCYSSCTQAFGHLFGAMSSYVFSPIFVASASMLRGRVKATGGPQAILVWKGLRDHSRR
jgi:hypothetical protein